LAGTDGFLYQFNVDVWPDDRYGSILAFCAVIAVAAQKAGYCAAVAR